MPRLDLVCASAIALSFLATSVMYAGEVSVEKPKFTFTIPDDFKADDAIKTKSRDFVEAFRRTEADGVSTLIICERMRGTIPQKPLDPKDLPTGFKGQLLQFSWNGFQIDVIEVPEEANGVKVVTFNIQVPLKGEAVQLKVVGRGGDQERDTKALATKILGSLKGDSNWTH